MVGHTMGVDIHMIGAALIDDTVASLDLFQASVVRRNLGMVEYNGIIIHAAQSDNRSAKRDRMNLRYDFLRYSAAIIVAEGDKGTNLVANTENIPARQDMTEGLIS